MKRILLTLAALAGLAGNAAADNLVGAIPPNVQQTVFKDSATIVLVAIASYTMTRVDIPKVAGSFVAELQNNDASDDACCAFDIAATTVTTSASVKSCRVVNKLGGTWAIQRWYRDLSIYCQTAKTSGTAKIVVVQGR